jgi:hypothetical protein
LIIKIYTTTKNKPHFTGSLSMSTWIDTIYLLYNNYFKADYIDISFGLSHTLFRLQNI